MVALASSFLGIGMYTPAEAAMYARISPRMMTRWVHGDRSGKAVILAQVEDPDRKTVTFLDFVQSLAVRTIRDQHGVSLEKIREAVLEAKRLGFDYPFAREHRTFLYGQDIMIETDAGDLLQASGRQRRQYAMKPIVEAYLVDLTFGPDGLATQYLACSRDDTRIVMSPDVHFGEPVVERSGVSAWALWEACKSEGSIEAAAKAWGATEAEVVVACRYIESIRPATAA